MLIKLKLHLHYVKKTNIMSSVFSKNEDFMTDKIIEKIFKKIKIAMASNGINQTQLAKKLGLTHPAVSAWFNGKSTPSLEVLLEIFKLLNKPANYFFADDSITQNIKGNHNEQQNMNGQKLELIRAKMEVLQKTLENFELRLKLLEKKK